MRLVWAHGIESRKATVVSPCLQASFEDLRAGDSRPPILRLHADKAREFLSPVIRTYLSQQGVRQTVNSGYGPQGNGLAERWIGITPWSYRRLRNLLPLKTVALLVSVLATTAALQEVCC